MIVLLPTSTVYKKEIKTVATVTELQNKIKKYIPLTTSGCVFFSLKDLSCHVFFQNSDSLCPTYNAKGCITDIPKFTFPISILRELFGITYQNELCNLTSSTPSNIYISVVNLDGKYFLKIIKLTDYSGGLRDIHLDLDLVCAKTSLYMDKAFAKAMPFPKPKLTNQQSLILGHVFDCLYVDDILTRVQVNAESESELILDEWATASWLNEFVSLAESVDLPIRDTVNRIQMAKRLRKVKRNVGHLISGKTDNDLIDSIYPVATFSLNFDKTFA